MTPLQKTVDTLWAAPNVRVTGTKEMLAETMQFCADQYGLIDRLTPGAVVLRHDDPRTPGDIRVKLATADVVLVLVYFKEAPDSKVAVEIPTKQWKNGMEHAVIAKALPGVVQMLLNKSREERTAEEKAPRIVLPG